MNLMRNVPIILNYIFPTSYEENKKVADKFKHKSKK